MDCARDVFELYGHYLGVQFIETAADGFTIATGDLRAVDPTIATGPGGVIGIAGPATDPSTGNLVPTVVLDAGDVWDDTFGVTDDLNRNSWFVTAMHEIGHLLGLGHTNELAPPTIMNGDMALAFDNLVEGIYPGDADIVHGQHLFRPESKDIDLYRFEVKATGLLVAETIAERLTDSSLLDSALALYKENPDGTRELVARNDDYFSEDSLIRLALRPGTYYVGVSASGNNVYDPVIQDSGIGGTTQGPYQLRMTFRPEVTESLVDATGTALDGDANGVPGGVYNYWFRANASQHAVCRQVRRQRWRRIAGTSTDHDCGGAGSGRSRADRARRGQRGSRWQPGHRGRQPGVRDRG